MQKVKRKWDKLTDARRKTCLEEIITFFKKERNEVIGIVSAGVLLDFFLEHIGEDLYVKGMKDTREIFQQHFADLEVDLDVLLNSK